MAKVDWTGGDTNFRVRDRVGPPPSWLKARSRDLQSDCARSRAHSHMLPFQRHTRVLLNDEHRYAGIANGLDTLPNGERHARSQPGSWLIQEKHAGVDHQRTRHAQHAALSSAQQPGWLAPALAPIGQQAEDCFKPRL